MTPVPKPYRIELSAAATAGGERPAATRLQLRQAPGTAKPATGAAGVDVERPFERRPRPAQVPANQGTDPRVDELVATLRDLKHAMEPPQGAAAEMVAAYRRGIIEICELRLAIDDTRASIESARREVASLRRLEQGDDGFRRAGCELDAVADETERATSVILGAAEDIEIQTRELRLSIVNPADRARLEIVLARVVALYEACDFQDLTGQRIARTLNVLRLMESRLDRVIAACGALAPVDSQAVATATRSRNLSKASRVDMPSDRGGSNRAAGEAIAGLLLPKATGEAPAEPRWLLHGPAVPGAKGHVTQADIDAMFDKTTASRDGPGMPARHSRP